MNLSSITATNLINYHERSKELSLKIPAFTNRFCETLYEFGRTLTRPWATGIAEVIKVCKPNPFLKRIWHLFLGLCALISSPLAIPGVILRLAFYRFRNPFAYETTSTTIKDTSLNDQGNEKVVNYGCLSWNTAQGPKFLSSANQLDYPDQRFEKITEMLIRENPSIVCLQEVFDIDETKRMSAFFDKNSYECVHSTNSEGLCLNSGLFIAIRKYSFVTIEKIGSWEFNNLVDDDRYCRKGLLGVKLKVGETRVFVFNTHLQASYGERSHWQVRVAQFRSVIEKIKEWVESDIGLADLQTKKPTILLCGDMNFAVHPPEERDPDHEYTTQKKTLNKLIEDLKNSDESLQDTGPATFLPPEEKKSDLKGKGAATKFSVPDIIFTNYANFSSDESHTRIVDKVKPETPVDRTFSDHRPVVIDFGLIIG